MKKWKWMTVLAVFGEGCFIFAAGVYLWNHRLVFGVLCGVLGLVLGSDNVFNCGRGYQVKKDTEKMEQLLLEREQRRDTVIYTDDLDRCGSCGGETFHRIRDYEQCQTCGTVREVGGR